jgi:hypothetical protein
MRGGYNEDSGNDNQDESDRHDISKYGPDRSTVKTEMTMELKLNGQDGYTPR